MGPVPEHGGAGDVGNGKWRAWETREHGIGAVADAAKRIGNGG